MTTLKANPSEILTSVRAFLELEGRHIDARCWDDWLAMYDPSVEYWIPTWVTQDSLGDSPMNALSHMYYANRGGLEDRVARILTGHSPATTPMPRTAHLISHVEVYEQHEDGDISVRNSWATHVFFPRNNTQTAFFGHTTTRLRPQANGGWLINRKRIDLLNDYVPTMMDFYCF